MLKRKNDYSVIVFFESENSPKKWKYVHKLHSFSLFLDKKHPDWKYMNVYNRRSGGFMKRYVKGTHTPHFLAE